MNCGNAEMIGTSDAEPGSLAQPASARRAIRTAKLRIAFSAVGQPHDGRPPRPAQSASRGSRQRQPLRLERLALPPLQRRAVEIRDELVEKAVPVDLGGKVEEDRAEADRRA